MDKKPRTKAAAAKCRRRARRLRQGKAMITQESDADKKLVYEQVIVPIRVAFRQLVQSYDCNSMVCSKVEIEFVRNFFYRELIEAFDYFGRVKEEFLVEKLAEKFAQVDQLIKIFPQFKSQLEIDSYRALTQITHEQSVYHLVSPVGTIRADADFEAFMQPIDKFADNFVTQIEKCCRLLAKFLPPKELTSDPNIYDMLHALERMNHLLLEAMKKIMKFSINHRSNRIGIINVMTVNPMSPVTPRILHLKEFKMFALFETYMDDVHQFLLCIHDILRKNHVKIEALFSAAMRKPKTILRTDLPTSP